MKAHARRPVGAWQVLPFALSWVPMTVGTAVLVATVLVWQALRAQEQHTLADSVHAAAVQVKNELTARLDARIQALVRMQHRWQVRLPTEAAWEDDAARYLRDFPGAQSLGWIDPSFRVRWITPRASNEAALGINAASEARRRTALEAARAQRTVRVTRMFELVQGGEGFVISLPIFVQGDFVGVHSAAFRAHTLLDTILTDIAPGYAVVLAAEGHPFYRRPADAGDGAVATPWRQDTTVTLPGITWQVRVWPEPATLAQHRSALPQVILGAGASLAVLVALALAFAQAARHRAREATVANRRLDALNAVLERRVRERTAELAEANAALRAEIDERVQAEAALRDSELRHRLVARATNDALWDWNLAANEARWTAALQSLFGYPEEEVGTDATWWYDHIHAQDRERVVAGVHALINSGEQFWSGEYRFRRRDGSYAYVFDRGYVVHDEQGKPVRMVGAMIDLSARRAAEEALAASEQRWRTLAEVMPALVWTARPDGFVEYYNQRWEAYAGLPAEQLAGWGWEAVWHPADLPAGRARWQESLRTGQPYEYEARLWRADGSFRWHLIRAVPLRDSEGRVLRWLGATIDIEEQKHLTEELRRSNAELQQFAYVASHDLQEPLRMVSLYVALLARRYRGRLDGDADEFIRYAVEGAQRMKALIDGLLAYSRVGARGQPSVPTDSASVLQQVLRDLQGAIAETRAVITAEPLPTVRADATQLGQVFQNLLSNALKFRSAAAPRVHISARQEGSEWVFAVQDNGIGIDPQYAERIFVMFQRLHRREQYPGTGIGLAICERIIERHGGRIWVESEPGQGGTFYFTLPAEPEPVPPPPRRE